MENQIMFFLPTLGGGGAEKTIIQLANSFIDENAVVSLVVCDLTGEKSKLLPEIHSNINLINLNCGRVANSLIPLIKLINDNIYDAIISTQTHANLICILAKMLSKSSAKIIVREVSTPSKNINKRGFSKNISNFFVRTAYKYTDKIVCVSDGAKEDFITYYKYEKKNIQTIYNPVLNDSFFDKTKVSISHKFFDPRYKVILGIGRLTEAKNFQLLIKSFSILHKLHPECRLIILGEGELRQELERLILKLNMQEFISLPGFDSNPYAYFKYSVLFVLSSNWEGLPGVLIQALASDIKVVSTDCPSGPNEILCGSKFGILTQCNNIEALVLAMQNAIYGCYVTYDNKDLNKHCQIFYKEAVIEAYKKLIREKQ